ALARSLVSLTTAHSGVAAAWAWSQHLLVERAAAVHRLDFCNEMAVGLARRGESAQFQSGAGGLGPPVRGGAHQPPLCHSVRPSEHTGHASARSRKQCRHVHLVPGSGSRRAPATERHQRLAVVVQARNAGMGTVAELCAAALAALELEGLRHGWVVARPDRRQWAAEDSKTGARLRRESWLTRCRGHLPLPIKVTRISATHLCYCGAALTTGGWPV